LKKNIIKECILFNIGLFTSWNIIYGKRYGLGKEYDCNDKMIFEGEYLFNKKWNGKGYDDNNNIIYELINGNGKAKEINNDGKPIYEGEYLNGQKNGKGKGYDYKGNLEYEGEYLNGKRNGKGKEYGYKGRLEFEGEYLNNKKWNGKGYDKNNNITFELINGKGIAKEYNKYNGNLEFEGEYLNGEKNGKGKEYDYDGN